MKLVYFSPTGTTKEVVNGVAVGINQNPMEVIDITKHEGRKQQLLTSENELLVIGVPVYYGRVPAVATDWLCTIHGRNTPAVCVVVYGNRAYDDALLELKETVVEHGCIPIACAAYIGEHSFSNSETPIAVARPDANDLSHAESFGKKVSEKLLSISSLGRMPGITVPGSHPYRSCEDPGAWVGDLVVDTDKCSQCGVCARDCPVGAIDLENNLLIDRRKCILCCACIKACPENARTVKAGAVRDIAVRLSQTCQARKEPAIFF